MPDISVIIPAYNVAEYLPRALDSLLAQTLRDFEIIIVDDGSTDSTGRICDEYARRDSRIHALHQPNAGAPAARNAAMEHASGRYMFFMDGDDWAEPQMLRDMLSIADRSDAELVIAGFYIDTYTSKKRCFTEKKAVADALYGLPVSFRHAAPLIFDNNLLYSLWNKLFRSSRINEENIRFRDMKMDDFPFVLDYIRDVSTVALTSQAYYHFTRARSDSETSRYYPGIFAKRLEEHRWMMELFTYWGQQNDDVAREFLARRHAERIFGCIETYTCSACSMPRSEKMAAIAEMIDDESTRWSLRYCRPKTLMVKIMLIPLRHRWVGLAYCMGTVMSFVKKHFTGVFARLKAWR